MAELEIEARVDNLDDVLAFLDEQLESRNCPVRQQMQLDVAVEEIFVNIASYAYGDKVGMAKISIEFEEDPSVVTVTFYDSGMPYDPLAREDPDVTLSVEDRGIGGLGIYMVKKSMDDVTYEYRDGQNVFSIRRNL
ncbi:MAG: ATP-binding protein [Lachnospiraceae bacterium]|nr:ATP-binding protein [Lachnospiraceae bacterium]